MTQIQLDGQINKRPRKVKSNTTIIDFGIGKLTCIVEPGSSITVTEIVEALERLAMTVPLQQAINAINRLK